MAPERVPKKQRTMEKKERNMLTYLYVTASILMRYKLLKGEEVNESDLTNIINQTFAAYDYKGKDIERQRMYDVLLLQYKRKTSIMANEKKLYRVCNRDKLELAIFENLDDAREFVTAFRDAYDLNLPNDVRIYVYYQD